MRHSKRTLTWGHPIDLQVPENWNKGQAHTEIKFDSLQFSRQINQTGEPIL